MGFRTAAFAGGAAVLPVSCVFFSFLNNTSVFFSSCLLLLLPLFGVNNLPKSHVF